MIKILVIGNRIPFPLHDGGALATYNLLQNLKLKGYFVSFFTLNTQKHFVKESTFNEKFSFLDKIYSHYINTSIKPISAFLNLFSSQSYNVVRFHSDDFLDKLRDELSQNHYDYVHFEGLYSCTYASFIKQEFPNINLVYRQHNIEFEIWERLTNEIKFIPKKVYINYLAKKLKNFELSVFCHFNHIISITESDKLITQKYFFNTVTSIGVGIEENKAVKFDVNLINQLYHIGSMEWLPNIEAVNWFYNFIWQKFKINFPLVHLHLAGKSMPNVFLDWNINQVHIYSFVENLNEFVKDKGVLIVPLRSGSGIRIKTMEAMMMGKIVMTTKVGIQGIEAKDKVHCLIFENIDEFISQYKWLTENPNSAIKISENAQKLMLENYSNSIIQEKWGLVYA